VGESGIVAAICGSFSCPCVFVSGDAATCKEVKALLGDEVVGVPVKIGLTRFSAVHLSASDACERIESQVEACLTARNWPKPLVFAPPVRFEVELASPERVSEFAGRTGVEVLDPRRVASTGDTFWEAWDHFWPR
ncbi:MAG TPA: M55 family metallopeptidase, partial [Chthonomonadaceae bacterium]|nr:M55 family metallopeptidase [Chthonomonadaceae bacterium]